MNRTNTGSLRATTSSYNPVSDYDEQATILLGKGLQSELTFASTGEETASLSYSEQQKVRASKRKSETGQRTEKRWRMPRSLTLLVAVHTEQL